MRTDQTEWICRTTRSYMSNAFAKKINEPLISKLYLLDKTPNFVTVENVDDFSKVKMLKNLHFISSKPIFDQKFVIEAPEFESFLYLEANNSQNLNRGSDLYNKVLNPMTSIESILGTNKINHISANNTTQKQEIVKEIEQFAKGCGFSSRLVNIIATATDEILMNSMFDSHQDNGEQILKDVPRSLSLPLVGKDRVDVKFGFNDEYFAVSSIDYHGTLDKVKLLKYLTQIQKSKRLEDSSGCGAGIGLATIYLQGANIVFCSKKNEKTEVIIFYKKTDSFKEFKALPKIISVNVSE